MTTITKEGQRVGILRTIGEAIKIGGTRVTSKTTGVAALLLLPAAVITKTAMESVPYVVNRVIDNASTYATLGYDQAKPFVENLKPMGSTALEGLVAGLTGLVITGGIVYGAFKLYKGAQTVGGQAKNEAGKAYQAREPIRQINQQVKVKEHEVAAIKKMRNLETSAGIESETSRAV